MDALMLVGGEGTRLRPLTLSQPKSMLPLVDRPFLAYPFAQLARAGVERVVLSCGYLPDAIQAEFGAGGAALGGLRVEYAVEDRPLGTAGAIRFAAEGRVRGRFLVLNGDVLSDFDLAALVARHEAAGASATIGLTPVDDPSRYGLVRTHADGAVLGFLEKPKPEEIDTDLINAGVYVLEPEVLERIPAGRAVSIEREVFPALIGHGLHAFRQDGYWIDIGTPASYLAAHRDILSGTVRTHLSARLAGSGAVVDAGASVDADAELVPPVWIGAGARVAAGARVGAGSALGPGAQVGADAVVEGSVLHAGASIGAGARVSCSVLGPEANAGEGCALDGVLVAAGTGVEEGSVLADEKVFPPEVEV